MEGKRFLLLLLVAIVSIGAWAQGQYVQELKVGENLVNIPSFSTEYRYSTDRSAYNLYKFETPYSGSFGIYVTGLTFLDKAFAMFDENGNYVKDSYSMGNGYTSPELEGHKTYYLGMRAKEANKSQNDKYLVEFQCAQHVHEYGEDGICTHEGCGKKEPVLHIGLNENVDCSYESGLYRFVPTKSGKLTVIAKNAYGEKVFIYYTLKDENGETIFTNYVASAPKRKAAGNNGCSVEADNTYFLDFSQNYSGTYNIVLEVEEELPPVELNDTQSNNVSFPAGDEQVTVFKYIATQTMCLNIAVETEAEIVGQVIMPWSEWEEMQDGGNNDTPASAPRKVNGKRKAETLISRKVFEGEAYAIAFLTNAEADATATITLSYSEVVYPEVMVGNNCIDIEAVYGDCDDNPEHYNIFKFVAPKSGYAHIYTEGNEDTYGCLFDSDMQLIDSNDDYDGGPDFRIDCTVDEGKKYYIGVRVVYSGWSISNYKLVIEIEGLPEYEGTLVLDDSKSLEDNLGEWKDKDAFTATGGVTYKRAPTTNKWGTVVLPYQLVSSDKVVYYELTAADIPNGKLEFTKVETVDPNTPTVFRIISGNQYDASVEGPVTIKVPEDMGDFDLYTFLWETEDEEWYMDGWYYEQVIDTQHDDFFLDEDGYPGDPGIMYISGDQFWHATGTVTVKPYRALFEVYGVNWSAASAKAMTILFKDDDSVTTIESVMEENGEFADIETIYDLYGHKIETMKRGVNIIRTSNGKIRKFIKK